MVCLEYLSDIKNIHKVLQKYYISHNLILHEGVHHLRVVSGFGVRSISFLGAKPLGVTSFHCTKNGGTKGKGEAKNV